MSEFSIADIVADARYNTATGNTAANAERGTKPTGFIIWRGASRIDGAPIVAIAIMHSTNGKTGDMIQVYFIRSDIPPMEASRTGADVSICGACHHRGKLVDGKLVGRSCYVTLFQGPRIVYDGFVRGIYPDISNDAAAIALLAVGRYVRLGAYGDPASVPVSVLDTLLSSASGHTGYSHQWKAPRLRDTMRYCQASCDTQADVDKAKSLGFGIFYVTPAGAPVPDGFILCPASEEAGKKVNCIDCLMCNGRGNYVSIGAHGAGATHVARRALPVLS